MARTPVARQIVPARYRTVRLDRGRFAQLLQRTPHEDRRPVAASDAELELPLPEGGFARFRIVESPVMAPALAKRYPQIRTWLGQGIDDPGTTLRFDLTHKGFHAQLLSAEGTTYIDPYQPGDNDTYISYRKQDHHHGETLRCSVTGERLADESPAKHLAHAKVSAGANLRTYRLAMAATGEYTAFHGGQVADALAGIVTTVNRVNGIYEREVAVRMQLVGDNDRIIYTNPATDPYNNDPDDIDLNPPNVDAQIGSANYDVGHLVGTGGGGVAYLGVICTGSKAGGLTGSNSPVGDGFDVDYVAHELGHQFGGDHTFNGQGGSCGGGNRSAGAAYEPGSGVTIQAYAGICGADDLQPNSEDFFHRKSLDQIIEHTTTGSGGGCGTLTPTGNAIPTVGTAPGFIIPASTPFELEASGSDGNGDDLTYSWEEFDLGNANTAGSLVDNGNRPLFRAFAPGSDPVRIFPSLRYVLGNANAVPTTAPLPGTTTPAYFTGELLPSTDRTLQFRVTVRDNRAGGGGSNEASTAINVEPGPAFAVTSPNTAVSWAAGSSQTVTWNAGNTAAAPINAAHVRILLSLDGGYTWPVELAGSDAGDIPAIVNDGSATVTVPPGTPSTAQARLKVKAVGNVFFDISNADFSIAGSNAAPVVTPGTALSTRQGSPTATATVATLSDDADAAGSLDVSVSGAPPELDVSVENIGGNVWLSATAACTLVAPTGSGTKTYPLRVQAVDSQDAVGAANVNVLVSSNLAPTLGTYTGDTIARPAGMSFSPSAGPADPNGNYAGISVSPTELPGGGTVSVAADGTVTVSTTASTTLGAHVVRVQARDECGAVEIREFTVTVISTTPSLDVVSGAVAGGNGLIEPGECNQLNLTLVNNGSVAATGVSATLGTSDPDVTVTQAVAAFADIPAGATRTSLTPFEISTGSGLVCLSDIEFDVEVTYAGAGSPFADTLTMTAGQPAAVNYAFATTTGATLPAIPGGTLVAGSNIDDGVFNVTVPAGFNFSLYGTPVTAGTVLSASTNGNLQFVASGASLNYANGALPSSGAGSYPESFPAAAPVLMPYWDDLTLASNGGGIYTHTLGSAPNRRWLVEWRGQPWVSNPNNVNTRFAIAFNEGVDGFEYIYTLTSNAGGATIGVQAATSGNLFTQFATNAGSLTNGTRLTATRAPAVCNAGAGGCSAVAGVTVTPSGGTTLVTEGGVTDSYTIVLTSAPSADVTVAVMPHADADVSPASLVFTPANWNVAQTVTVTAIDDRVVEGAHAASLAHAASGGGYDGVTVASVAVSVTDNDSAAYRFTQATSTAAESTGTLQIATALDFTTSGSGSPALEAPITVPVMVGAASTATGGGIDYTLGNASVSIAADGSAATVPVTLIAGAVAEASETLVLDLGAETGGSAAQQLAVASGAPASHVLTITDADVAGVTLAETGGGTAVTEGGAGDGYSLVLTSQPTGEVTVTLAPDAQLSAVPDALVFTPANWNVAQNVAVSAIDDSADEGAHAGDITHTASGGGYGTVIVPGLAVDIADNDASADLSVSVTRLPGLVLPGSTVSFEVTAANLDAATDAPGATFAFTLAPALSGVQWTCAADVGASCSAGGSGLPAHAITLAPGSGVLYTITGQVPAGTAAGTVFTGTATIAPAAPLVDGNAANDSATATATVDGAAIFRDGFESP